MDKYNTTTKSVKNILTNNTPHSIGSLARKTNVSRKYIQYILASNPELFTKAHPSEVGSWKWCNLKQKSQKQIDILRKRPSLWKLV